MRRTIHMFQELEIPLNCLRIQTEKLTPLHTVLGTSIWCAWLPTTPHTLKFYNTLTLTLCNSDHRSMQEQLNAFEGKKNVALSELRKINPTVTTKKGSDRWSRLTNWLTQFLAKQQTTGMEERPFLLESIIIFKGTSFRNPGSHCTNRALTQPESPAKSPANQPEYDAQPTVQQTVQPALPAPRRTRRRLRTPSNREQLVNEIR